MASYEGVHWMEGRATQTSVRFPSNAIHRLGVAARITIGGSEATSAAPRAVGPGCRASGFVAATRHSRNSML
jgi:hypothetical protein